MLPILDFFYGIVPSYGLAIVALTLVVRFALYPVSAGQIRNMRRMKIAQPLMKERQEQIKSRYKDDPAKQQEELGKLFQEFGNPLAGCLPLLIQMPVLFALFATLRGSPFTNINYTVNVEILPKEQIERIQPQVFATKPQNIYLADGVRERIVGLLPSGDRLAVGETTEVEFQTVSGKPLKDLVSEYDDSNIQPQWTVTKGEERLQVNPDGTVTALQAGDATIQGTIPGIAANKGFLFIKALGRVGATDANGNIHWDIVIMVAFFGISMYVNQLLSGQQSGGDNSQQQTTNRLLPIVFTGMFLFFPLPAGVLMYIVIANIFQTLQSFVISREPLPENLQKIVEQQKKTAKKSDKKSDDGTRKTLPFEPGYSKKKEKAK